MTVHCLALGDEADKVLLENISRIGHGDFCFCSGTQAGLAVLRQWLNKRVVNQYSKVASNVSIHIQSASGVQIRVANNFNVLNSQHLLLKNIDAMSMHDAISYSPKSTRYQLSRRSLRSGRSLRNGSSSSNHNVDNVTPFTTIDGEAILVDNFDITRFVEPLQRAWRSYAARRIFSQKVDEAMQNVVDPDVRARKAQILQQVAQRQVAAQQHNVTTVIQNAEPESTVIPLPDFSFGHSSHICLELIVNSKVMPQWYGDIGTVTISYVDYRDGGNAPPRTIQRPIQVVCSTLLIGRQSHPWLTTPFLTLCQGDVNVLSSVDADDTEDDEQLEVQQEYSMKTGDWLRETDTLIVSKGRAEFQLIDGTTVYIEEAGTQVVFQSYDVNNHTSELVLLNGSVYISTAVGARCLLEVPIVDKESLDEATLLTPPSYALNIHPLTYMKASMSKPLFRTHTLVGNVITKFIGRSVRVGPLQQTLGVSPQSWIKLCKQSKEIDLNELMPKRSNGKDNNDIKDKQPVAPWHLDEGEFEWWLKHNPFLATYIIILSHMCRVIAAHTIKRIALLVRRATHRRPQNQDGERSMAALRARALVITQYVRDLKEFNLSTLAHLTEMNKALSRYVSRVSGNVRGKRYRRDKYLWYSLMDLSRTIAQQRSCGTSTAFQTFSQITVTAKHETVAQTADREQGHDALAADILQRAKDAETRRREAELDTLSTLWNIHDMYYEHCPRTNTDQLSVNFVILQQVVLAWANSGESIHRDPFMDVWNIVCTRKMVGVTFTKLELAKLLLTLTANYPPDVFNHFIAFVTIYLENLPSLIANTREARAMWNLFQAWDSDAKGSISSDDFCCTITDVDPFPEDAQSIIRLKHALQELDKMADPYELDTEFGKPLVLSEFSYCLKLIPPRGTPESDFQDFLWLLRREVEQRKHSEVVLPSMKWKDEKFTEEIGHLITWDLRHVFDGITDSDIIQLGKYAKSPQLLLQKLQMNLEKLNNTTFKNSGQVQHEKEQYVQQAEDEINAVKHKLQSVAGAVCILAGILPARRKPLLRESPDDFWGPLWENIRKDWDEFTHWLIAFPLMSITRNQVEAITKYVNDASFSIHVMNAANKVLGCLVQWTLVVLKIVLLMNGWEYHTSGTLKSSESSPGPLAVNPEALLSRKAFRYQMSTTGTRTPTSPLSRSSSIISTTSAGTSATIPRLLGALGGPLFGESPSQANAVGIDARRMSLQTDPPVAPLPTSPFKTNKTLQKGPAVLPTNSANRRPGSKAAFSQPQTRAIQPRTRIMMSPTQSSLLTPTPPTIGNPTRPFTPVSPYSMRSLSVPKSPGTGPRPPPPKGTAMTASATYDW